MDDDKSLERRPKIPSADALTQAQKNAPTQPQTPATIVNPSAIDEITRLIQPLLTSWSETTTEQRRIELEHEDRKHDRELKHEQFLAQLRSSDARYYAKLGIGIFGVIGLAAIALFLTGQSSSGMDLLKMTVPAGFAFLAGMGVEARRQKVEPAKPKPE